MFSGLGYSVSLACLAYVDLNPIRAGLAETPEESRFTSARERITARRWTGLAHERPGRWLHPITRGEVPEKQGLLELTLDEYLELLDWTGRNIRPGATGAIPADLDPILQRLGIQPGAWVKTARNFGGFFQRFAGRAESIKTAARRLGRTRLRGLKAGGIAFQPI